MDVQRAHLNGGFGKAFVLNAADLGIALYQAAQLRVAVDVLVEQVAEAARPAGVAGLRAEGAQPHEVAGLDLHPVVG